MKFPIGTRVICDFTPHYLGRRTGTVVADPCGVRFDKEHRMFHTLSGACEMGYGYWCDPDSLMPISTTRIEDDPEYSDLFI